LARRGLDLCRAARNPYLVLVIATLAISCSAILIKFSSAQPLVLACYRMAITTVLLLPFVRGETLRQIRALDRRSLALIGCSGLMLALHFGLWTASLGYTSVASSVLFVSVHPALVAAVAWTWTGERLSRKALLGIALTLAGSAAIAGGDVRLGGAALEGDALAFLGAVALAGYLLIGRDTRRHLNNVAYSVPVYGACALILGLLAVAFGQPLTAIRPKDLLIFLALALIPTLAGHLLYNWTLRYLQAALVSASFLGEPVFAALLAWPLLGQPLAAATVGGGLVILAGIYLTARG
jgi:drug/metabolite transporter (DMT)-like permease